MSTPGDLRWWEEPKEKKHDAVFAIVDEIDRAQSYRQMDDLMHAALYGNCAHFAFTPHEAGQRVGRTHAKLSLNVVKNMVCSVVSRVAAKNKIHSKFLTSGGEWSLQRKAQKLEKLTAGIKYAQKWERKKRQAFRDCAIFGTGIVKVHNTPNVDNVVIERVPKWEVMVDDADAYNGDPRCMYHRKWVDKRVLQAMFPEHREAIEKLQPRMRTNVVTPIRTLSHIIPVIEAYHRPSGPNEEDGERAILVESATLGVVPWVYDYHPLPSIRWNEEPQGWFGTGIAHDLAGIQAEINELLMDFQRAHRLLKGHWAVEEGSRVLLRHINDDLASIVKYAGTEPRYYQPTAIPPDTYRYLWDLYGKAYEITGISQLAAGGQRPVGLNSGEAQRVYADQQTERFLDIGAALEEWSQDVDEQVVDRARDVVATHKKFPVTAKSNNALEVIDLADVDLPRDQYQIQAFPTSMLPNTPAGRIAFVQDAQESLGLDQDDALQLVGFPDLEAYASRRNAKRENLERNIETMLDKGEWVAPEPLDDHEFAMRTLPDAIAKARNDKAPPENISLLRRYLTLTVKLAEKAAPPPPPPPPPPPMGPGDMPGGPPPMPGPGPMPEAA